jgi:PAS domain S-box-containing protein
MSIVDVLAPDEIPRVADEVARLRGGAAVKSEWRFRRKDGSIFHGEVHGRQLADSRLLGYVRDISAHRQIEDDLRASQKFIDAVAKASPPMIYVFDLDERRLRYQNRSILADLGHPPSVAAIDRLDDFKAFIPAEDEAHLENVLREWRSLPDGQVREDEYRLRTAQGALHWFLGRETAFTRGTDGAVRQVLGTLDDITQRKRTELSLENSRALLQSFVEHTPAAVAMLDKDLRYIAVSRRWIQDYELGTGDLRGKRHYDLFPEIRKNAPLAGHPPAVSGRSRRTARRGSLRPHERPHRLAALGGPPLARRARRDRRDHHVHGGHHRPKARRIAAP